jgi:Fic family protein
LTSAKRLSAATGISIPTINSALAALEKLGITRETTGRKRDRLFSYAEYLRLLGDEGD